MLGYKTFTQTLTPPLPPRHDIHPKHALGFREEGPGVVGFQHHGAEEVDAPGEAGAEQGVEVEFAEVGVGGLAEGVPGHTTVDEGGEFGKEGFGGDEGQLLRAREWQPHFETSDQHFGTKELIDGALVGVEDVLCQVEAVAPHVPGIAQKQWEEAIGVLAVAAVVHHPGGEGHGFCEEIFAKIDGEVGEVEITEVLLRSDAEENVPSLFSRTTGGNEKYFCGFRAKFLGRYFYAKRGLRCRSR